MTVEICLVRHAIAEERGPTWSNDDLRPLTPGGRAKMATAAAGLATLFVPDVILSSPLLRAIETAEILARQFAAPIHVCDALATGEHGALLDDVAATGRRRIVCVGHEPWMSGALSWLLTGDAGAIAAFFRKGAAALVSLESHQAGAAMLEWLLQPSALRALAAAPRS